MFNTVSTVKLNGAECAAASRCAEIEMTCAVQGTAAPRRNAPTENAETCGAVLSRRRDASVFLAQHISSQN